MEEPGVDPWDEVHGRSVSLRRLHEIAKGDDLAAAAAARSVLVERVMRGTLTKVVASANDPFGQMLVAVKLIAELLPTLPAAAAAFSPLELFGGANSRYNGASTEWGDLVVRIVQLILESMGPDVESEARALAEGGFDGSLLELLAAAEANVALNTPPIS